MIACYVMSGALPMPHPQLGIDLGLDGVAHDEVRVALPANTGYGWFNFTVLPHGSTSAPFTASVNYTFPRGALGFVDIKFV